MPHYREPTHNVFATNNDGQEGVMVFSILDAETLRKAFARKGVTFDEMYEVPDADVGTYCFEPCWLTADEEDRARALAE